MQAYIQYCQISEIVLSDSAAPSCIIIPTADTGAGCSSDSVGIVGGVLGGTGGSTAGIWCSYHCSDCCTDASESSWQSLHRPTCVCWVSHNEGTRKFGGPA